VEAALILEFFGPPGSGKTTFAISLANHLREAGYPVVLRLSARPGENSPGAAPSPQPISDAFRRLVAPACELMFNVAKKPNASGGRVVSELTQALPQGEIFRALRMRQYLARLSNSWMQAARNRKIWIFDQAYIQAVASIAEVQPGIDDATIGGLLDVVPQSDLAIHVEAPVKDIENRISRRMELVGRVGRLFEERRFEAPKQAALANRIDGLLNQRGRQVLALSSADGESLDDHVREAERAIIAQFNELAVGAG
jgi:thymidylate kinase